MRSAGFVRSRDPEYFLIRFTLDLVPDPTVLRITKMIPVADGMDLEVQGSAGGKVTILVSSDFQAWEPLATVQPDANNSARLHVALPGASGTRFFPATTQPAPAIRALGEDSRSKAD